MHRATSELVQEQVLIYVVHSKLFKHLTEVSLFDEFIFLSLLFELAYRVYPGPKYHLVV